MPRSRYQGDGRPKLVERVEARYPGTEKWLFSPLWRLADEAPMEMSELRQVYDGLPGNIRDLIILASSLANPIFWRREFDNEEMVAGLLQYRSLNELITALALVREAEICQRYLEYQFWVKVALVLLKSIDLNGLEKTTLPQELEGRLRQRWNAAKPILEEHICQSF